MFFRPKHTKIILLCYLTSIICLKKPLLTVKTIKLKFLDFTGRASSLYPSKSWSVAVLPEILFPRMTDGQTLVKAFNVGFSKYKSMLAAMLTLTDVRERPYANRYIVVLEV